MIFILNYNYYYSYYLEDTQKKLNLTNYLLTDYCLVYELYNYII